jgi:hypothetical protein
VSSHTFRQDHGEEIQPWREHIRHSFPNGSDGYTPEDLDLVFRRFGVKRGEDSIGSFKLIEFKRTNIGYLQPAQQRTFSLIDAMLRRGDEGNRYRGFYLANWLEQDGIVRPIVNGERLTLEQFDEFLDERLEIKPFGF